MLVVKNLPANAADDKGTKYNLVCLLLGSSWLPLIYVTLETRFYNYQMHLNKLVYHIPAFTCIWNNTLLKHGYNTDFKNL